MSKWNKVLADAPDTVHSIPTEDILVVSKFSGRSVHKRAKEAIKALAESMQMMGQEQPAIVCLNTVEEYGEIGAPLLLCGFGRYEAAQQNGTKLNCIVSSVDPQDEVQARLVGLHENSKREDLTAVQIADAIADLRKLGLSNKEIAKSLGMKDSNLSFYARLIATDEAGEPIYSANALKLIHDGKIPAREAMNLFSLGSAKRVDKAIEKAMAKAKEAGKSTAQTSDLRAGAREEEEENGVAEKTETRGRKATSEVVIRARSVKEIKEELSTWTGPAEHPLIKSFAGALTQFLDGKIDAVKLRKRIDAEMKRQGLDVAA